MRVRERRWTAWAVFDDQQQDEPMEVDMSREAALWQLKDTHGENAVVRRVIVIEPAARRTARRTAKPAKRKGGKHGR